jgi:phosphonopyruvate decarboxylase
VASSVASGAPLSDAVPAASSAPKKDQVTPLTEKVRDFLEPADFYALLKERGLDFYAGVPDSLLSDFCAYVTDASPQGKHVITANEGAAIGLAAGYYLATRQFPVVYMQNSGFGNAINPLLSLCDPKVYSIPMLLLIGWRGEPGKKDEPQHIVQGKVMSSLLTDLGIQFEILPDYIEGAREAVDSAVHYLERRSGPYAFLVKRQTFTPYSLQNVEPNLYELNREQALGLCIDGTTNFDVLVTTTGFTSREVYELREAKGQDHRREFLTVGSMGHASVIALGIAIAKPTRQVFCLDGDGAMLMHMGSMATIGRTVPCSNFKHILVNNGSHDSVGGQPTRGFDVDFCSIATAAGYKHVFKAKTSAEITEAMKKLREVEGPAFLEIYVNKGARKNLGRPKSTPIQNKTEFMRFLA